MIHRIQPPRPAAARPSPQRLRARLPGSMMFLSACGTTLVDGDTVSWLGTSRQFVTLRERACQAQREVLDRLVLVYAENTEVEA